MRKQRSLSPHFATMKPFRQAAAGHIGTCASCQGRLRDYIEIGVELRRVASLESLEEARPRAWEKNRVILSIWWQKGWETMRIPRFAFALLLMGIIGLSSGLTLVGVRAHAREAAIMLTVALEPDHVIPCGLSLEDKKYSAAQSGPATIVMVRFARGGTP